jgi:hypothetical protein
VPALGAISSLAVLLAWLANPYLALLLVPTAHVWLTCARREGSLAWPFVVGAAALSLLPAAAALAHVSSTMGLGSASPWLLLLMVSDGQFGFATMFALCLVLGGLLGIVAVSLRRPSSPRRRPTQAAPGDPAEPRDDLESDRQPVGSPTEGLDTFPIMSPGPADDLRSERQAPHERQ